MSGSLPAKEVLEVTFGALKVPNSGKKCQNHCKNKHLRASRNSEAEPPDPPKTQHPVQNRPWVPHAGGQDYGSLHKLPQIIPNKPKNNAKKLKIMQKIRKQTQKSRKL